MTDAGPGNDPRSLTATANRFAARVKWASIVIIAASLFLVVRRFPLAPILQALEGWVGGLGVGGSVAFALIYVVVALLLGPAWAMTLGAGAIFGLVWGTVVASVASTTAAALAFLIARHLARARVARLADRSYKFGAVDRAVSEGGWRIVALLRLSPAVPFTLQNYLYGLTGIRFWPCVITSWVAMLPGTFMYVYLGHVGRAGLEATTGGRARTPAEWVLMVVGLLATVAVTVYVTRLARRALKQHADVEKPDDQHAGSPLGDEPRPTGWPWGATVLAASALAAVGVAVVVQSNPGLVSLGPPEVELREAYEEKPGGPTFDHTGLDDLLRAYVDADGWVEYDGLLRDGAKLDAYVQSLSLAPFDDMGRTERLALLINAYNAFTLRLILDFYPVASIQDIPAPERWDAARWRVGPHLWSLNQIEHDQIRPKFREPRVHFALVCAAVGCPKLRKEAYRADRLNDQLEDQTRYVHGHDRWFRFEPGANAVRLTRLYLWYGGDFRQVAGTAPKFAARYSPALQRALDAGRTPRVEWLPYDWALNSRRSTR